MPANKGAPLRRHGGACRLVLSPPGKISLALQAEGRRRTLNGWLLLLAGAVPGGVRIQLQTTAGGLPWVKVLPEARLSWCPPRFHGSLAVRDPVWAKRTWKPGWRRVPAGRRSAGGTPGPRPPCMPGEVRTEITAGPAGGNVHPGARSRGSGARHFPRSAATASTMVDVGLRCGSKAAERDLPVQGNGAGFPRGSEVGGQLREPGRLLL